IQQQPAAAGGGARCRPAAVRRAATGQTCAGESEPGVRHAHAAPGARPVTEGISMNRQFDIVIAGGGMVGAALALMLARWTRLPPARIAVIEPRPAAAPAPGAPIGQRVSNISPVNRQRLEQLAAWQRLDARRLGAVRAMTIWHESVPPDSPDALRFDAAESATAELGVIVENLALQAALLDACRDAGIVLVEDTLGELAVTDAGVRVGLATQTLQAELVVGADGAASSVRGLLGLAAGTQDYGQRAIVATIRPQRAHRGTA